jgi:hypothetical protein
MLHAAAFSSWHPAVCPILACALRTESQPLRRSLQLDWRQIRHAAHATLCGVMCGQCACAASWFRVFVTAMARPGPSQRLQACSLCRLRYEPEAGQLADARAVSAGGTDTCTLTQTSQGAACKAEPCPGAFADWSKCQAAFLDAPKCPAGAVQYLPRLHVVCCHAQVHTA